MPTDISQILANLTSFYSFRDKRVVHVGVGAGNLLGYASLAQSVYAVDSDSSVTALLQSRVATEGLESTVSVVTRDFFEFVVPSDVVLLEFCLHEMKEPERALRHARSLASDVVVIDHLQESKWLWYADETEGAVKAWAAISAGGPRKTQSYEALQRFDDYGSLQERFAALGSKSRERIVELAGQAAITIPMPYGIALL
jgi:tRNA A58 N-methylase Trm61